MLGKNFSSCEQRWSSLSQIGIESTDRMIWRKTGFFVRSLYKICGSRQSYDWFMTVFSIPGHFSLVLSSVICEVFFSNQNPIVRLKDRDKLGSSSFRPVFILLVKTHETHMPTMPWRFQV